MTITDSRTRTAVRRAGTDDRPAAVQTITEAFFDDPVTEWLLPDLGDRRTVLPGVMELYFDSFLPHDETYLTDDDAGAALWLPPGRAVIPPDQLDEFGRCAEEVCGPYAARLFELDEFFEHHAPEEPHWHLQILAVRPDHQGLGLGSGLMEDLFPRVDRAGEAVYLESTTPRSRALYERHGFECFGVIVLPDGPPMWQMWRSPR